TYRIVVDEDVKNDDGYTMSKDERTVKFTTPSVNDSRPEAKYASVDGKSIIVHFDRDLSEDDVNLEKLTKVKSATNKELAIESIDGPNGKTLTINMEEELHKD